MNLDLVFLSLKIFVAAGCFSLFLMLFIFKGEKHEYLEPSKVAIRWELFIGFILLTILHTNFKTAPPDAFTACYLAIGLFGICWGLIVFSIRKNILLMQKFLAIIPEGKFASIAEVNKAFFTWKQNIETVIQKDSDKKPFTEYLLKNKGFRVDNNVFSAWKKEYDLEKLQNFRNKMSKTPSTKEEITFPNDHFYGSWRLDESHCLGAINSGEKHIAMVSMFECPNPETRVTRAEQLANARLIAKAPELLSLVVDYYLQIKPGDFPVRNEKLISLQERAKNIFQEIYPEQNS